jgi:hypothetical protein
LQIDVSARLRRTAEFEIVGNTPGELADENNGRKAALCGEHFCHRNFHFHTPPKKIEKDADPVFCWK